MEIYCADMTMLIAASSRAADNGGYFLCNPRALADPEASQSFECLGTIACNDTRVFFRKPEYLPFRSPIIEAWLKIAQTVEAPKFADLDDQERLAVMLPIFVDWLYQSSADGGSNARKLADFIAFQFSYPALMDHFWANNSLSKLKIALAVLEQYPVTAMLAEEIRKVGIRADARSRREIGAMDDTEYALAYGFRGFIKGFRYSAGLPDNNVYAVHWLRDKAITAGVVVHSTTESTDYRRLFPWGVFLNTLPELNSVAFGADEVTDLILNLRKYTSNQLDQLPSAVKIRGAIDYSRMRDFVRQGLRESLPLRKLDLIDSDWVVRLLVLSFARHVFKADPVVALLAGEVSAQTLRIKLPDRWLEAGDLRIDRVIRRLRYPLSTLRLFREHETALESFCAARGWTNPTLVQGGG